MPTPRSAPADRGSRSRTAGPTRAGDGSTRPSKPLRWCAVIPIRALTTRSAGGKDLQESGEEVLNRVYEALIRVANQRDAETETTRNREIS